MANKYLEGSQKPLTLNPKSQEGRKRALLGLHIMRVIISVIIGIMELDEKVEACRARVKCV